MSLCLYFGYPVLLQNPCTELLFHLHGIVLSNKQNTINLSGGHSVSMENQLNKLSAKGKTRSSASAEQSEISCYKCEEIQQATLGKYFLLFSWFLFLVSNDLNRFSSHIISLTDESGKSEIKSCIPHHIYPCVFCLWQRYNERIFTFRTRNFPPCWLTGRTSWRYRTWKL